MTALLPSSKPPLQHPPDLPLEPHQAHPPEPDRLRTLHRYAILDTPPEPSFDRVTRLAARLLRVPFAAIAFVDDHRVWFKSRHGFPIVQTLRQSAPCAHAMLGDSLTLIPDAALDPRFKDSALVSGHPHIRFYAALPLKSPAGHPLGTLSVMDTAPRDLTADDHATLIELAASLGDLLETRLTLRQHAQRLEAILQVDSGVVMNDPSLPDSPLVFANPAFSRITGYATEEILGRNCRFLQGPETSAATLETLRHAIADRRTFQGELLNYRKDGTPFWNELTVSPVFDAAGELINFIGVQADITERKRTADQLRESIVKQAELESQRDSLTAMIIHDLRSPLTSVLGFLDLLKLVATPKLDDKEKHYIELARRSTSAVADMITSLLDVGRLEAGEMPVKLRQTDLRAVITAAVEPFLLVIGARTLTCDLPAQPVPVLCDPELVQRVLTNLVSNAVKYTSAQTGEIRVALIPQAGRVKVTVTDNGIGIPAEYHTRVFEKFGQVDGRQHRHSTGLGLAFCRLAIEAQKGSIGLESSQGQGTTMWFIL